MIDRSLPPTPAGLHRDTRARTLRLEQRTDKRGFIVGSNTLVTTAAAEIPFSFADQVVVNESPPWAPSKGVRVRGLRVLLGTAGTASTVVRLRKNGSNTGATITLASSEDDSGVVDFATEFAYTDLLSVAVTTAGAGAADLTVIVYYL